MLFVEDLWVSYGAIVALRGISLSVQPGELLCVVGPNGAGKSTAMRAISGLVRPDRGTICLNGTHITRMHPETIVRLGMVMVPEGRQVFTRLTVEENLRIGATIRRDRKQLAEDLRALIRRFPFLGERRRQAAGTLSGGEQQQLAIARALLAQPRVLLVDEPSLGLAPRIVDDLYDDLVAMRDEGLAVLVVEQNVNRALKVADRICVLRTGQIEMAGTPEELVDTPNFKSRFETAYFGFSS